MGRCGGLRAHRGEGVVGVLGELISASAVVFVIVAHVPFVRRAVGRRVARAADWARARAAEVNTLDPDAQEMWNAHLRRRLLRDIDRVRGVVASDGWMTGTRQLGNRMALRALLADLRDLPDPLVLAFGRGSYDAWQPREDQHRDVILSPGRRPGSVVEVLELGWR